MGLEPARLGQLEARQSPVQDSLGIVHLAVPHHVYDGVFAGTHTAAPNGLVAHQTVVLLPAGGGCGCGGRTGQRGSNGGEGIVVERSRDEPGFERTRRRVHARVE